MLKKFQTIKRNHFMLKKNKNTLKYQLRDKKYRTDMQQEIHTRYLKHDDLNDETHIKKSIIDVKERRDGYEKMIANARKIPTTFSYVS